MPLALPVLASVAGRKALAKPVALGVSDVWHAGRPLALLVGTDRHEHRARTNVPACETSAPAASSPGEAERGRLREFLASQQRRWSQAELQLLEQVEQLIGQLSAGGADARRRRRRRRRRGRSATSSAAAEVEALKARIAELERQLAQAQSSGRGPAGGVLDWEAEKCRILAALELEISGDDEAAAGQRMELEAGHPHHRRHRGREAARGRAIAGPAGQPEQQPGLGGRGSGRPGQVARPGRHHSPRAGNAEATARAVAGETSPGRNRDLVGAGADRPPKGGTRCPLPRLGPAGRRGGRRRRPASSATGRSAANGSPAWA